MRAADDIEQTVHTYGDAVWRACLLYLAPCDAPFNDAGHVKAWLLRVAINACKDVLKAARSNNESVDALAEQGRVAELGCTDDRAALELARILDAMNELDDPPKTQVYLALYEGYTAREISQLCDMPEGTVYSWISRGKKRLREVLS